MIRLLLALALAALPSAVLAQAAAVSMSPLAAQFDQVLRRSSDGHSPTPEDIATADQLKPVPTAADLSQALPLIEKALGSPDVPVRTYTLTVLSALALVAPDTPASVPADAPAAGATTVDTEKTVAPPQTGPSAFKPEFAKILAPAIPQLAPHLTEESVLNRTLTVTILGSFSPDPPPAVYPPLLLYLQRDDAISPVGLAVVQAILQLGPLTDDAVTQLTRYLRRRDQTADSKANLIDAIATRPQQNQALDRALLAYLDSDDPTVQARLILSLPQLDLPADVFSDTRARVSQIADAGQDNPQVVRAAKSVAPCWTATKMASGCPAY